MHSFKIRPGGYKDARKKILIWGIPIMLIGVVSSFVLALESTGDKISNIKPASYYYTNNSYDWLVYLIPFVIILSAASFGIYRTLARVKKMFDSYELSISNNLIAREQLNTPTISIYLHDVQEIVKRKNGSYFVRGKKAHDLILIPSQIENPEQLQMALEQIKPISTKGKATTKLKLQSLLGLVAIGLMVCVYTVNNKIVVAIAGTLFTAIYGWSFIQIQKSKNVDYRTKRLRWVRLLALLIVIYFMITKLTDSPLF